jgi:nucleoside phosphorylase
MKVTDLKGKVDFGILTIREDENAAVLRRFAKVAVAEGQRQYRIRRLALPGGSAYTLAVLRCLEQGTTDAQASAHALLEDLAPRFVLVVGIAGGVPSYEFSLGDVVVSSRIVDFSVEAVLRDKQREYALSGGPLHPDAARLAADVSAMIADGDLGDWNSPNAIGMSRPPISLADDRFYGDDDRKASTRKKIMHRLAEGAPPAPLATTGAIASSDRLIKNDEILSVWLKIARQVVAVEMESAGIYKATHGRNVPFLAIRGISDVVGFQREHPWTPYACETAAAFTRAFLLTRPVSPGETSRDPVRSTPPSAPPGASGSAAAAPNSPSDPILVMEERLRHIWLPALRNKRERGLPLDEGVEALFRSVAPIIRPTPHWIDVLDRYSRDPALPARLPEEEEYAIRELRNLGLLSHDGKWLFTPTRSKNVAPTSSGAVVVALRSERSVSPFAVARDFIHDLAALDDATLSLLEVISTSGRIPDGESTPTRRLRGRCLINQAEYFLAGSDKATPTELGLYVLKWRRNPRALARRK